VQGIDVGRVTAWLDANIAGAQSPYRFALIAGGRSNLTYTVTDPNSPIMKSLPNGFSFGDEAFYAMTAVTPSPFACGDR